MKSMLLSGLAVALMASVVVAAEGRSLRSTLQSSLTQSLQAQPAQIPLPAPTLSPVPDPLYSRSVQQTSSQITPTPMPYAGGETTYVAPSQPGVVIGQPIELFSDVRVRAPRNIAPCAVPMIIQVPNPCEKNSCCKTCVNIQICVPPCDPQCVKVTRDGNRVCYDFGKYSVVAKTFGDHIVVRYFD